MNNRNLKTSVCSPPLFNVVMDISLGLSDYSSYIECVSLNHPGNQHIHGVIVVNFVEFLEFFSFYSFSPWNSLVITLLFNTWIVSCLVDKKWHQCECGNINKDVSEVPDQGLTTKMKTFYHLSRAKAWDCELNTCSKHYETIIPVSIIPVSKLLSSMNFFSSPKP